MKPVVIDVSLIFTIWKYLRVMGLHTSPMVHPRRLATYCSISSASACSPKWKTRKDERRTTTREFLVIHRQSKTDDSKKSRTGPRNPFWALRLSRVPAS